jgi:ribosomal protein S18 acetylase RimI-like enzyme
VRPATPNDIAAIVGLLREGDAHHRPFDELAVRQEDASEPDTGFLSSAMSDPDVLLLVAEQDEAVVGFVRATLGEKSETRLRRAMRGATIEELVVSKAARRRGHASGLMDRVRAWAREAGAERVTLRVFAANTAALRFYEALGYRVLVHTMVQETEP